MRRISIAFLALALVSCGERAIPRIEISDAWARETSAGQSAGAAYATIENTGGADDELLAVTTDRATMPMLHSSESVNGVSRMRMLQSLSLPADGTVELRPGGIHIMMEGLKSPLKAGETFEVTFRFKQSGELVVPVKVEAAGAR